MALALGAAATPARAQQAGPPAGPQPGVTAQPNLTPAPPYYGSISVNKGAGTLVKLPHPVSNIFAADPAEVSVRPASPDRLFIFGKGTGETTIVATDASGNTRTNHYQVNVPSEPTFSPTFDGDGNELTDGARVRVA